MTPLRLLIPMLLCVLASCMTRPATTGPKPVEVRVVVVTMFEIGADSGDTAGEFQLWHERQKLDVRYPFAHHHDLFFNPKTGVLGMVTGEGSINSASAVMELGMDPRFDLSHAYWLVAGIAGVDPEDASIGSAAWAEYNLSRAPTAMNSRCICWGIFEGARCVPKNPHGAERCHRNP